MQQGIQPQGLTIWFTGLSGSGKSSIGCIVEELLRARRMKVELLDGDVIRTHLSKGLGFSKEDRDTNIRRIGWVAEVLCRNGVCAIAAAISPYAALRDEIRSKISHFIEVYCDAPIEVLAQRDVKGLYKKAMAGEIQNFTGITDPYEPPSQPEVHLKTNQGTPQEYAAVIIRTAELLGFLEKQPLPVPVDDAQIIAQLAKSRQNRC